MSPRNWRERVEDILQACEHLESYTRGLSYAESAGDTRTIHAAAYELSIIGEAARHIPDEVRQEHGSVPWNLMQGMRKVIVHEYFRVDSELLWETVHGNLMPLVPALRRILNDEPAE